MGDPGGGKSRAGAALCDLYLDGDVSVTSRCPVAGLGVTSLASFAASVVRVDVFSVFVPLSAYVRCTAPDISYLLRHE